MAKKSELVAAIERHKKQKQELAVRPNVPATPTPAKPKKHRPPKRDAASRDEQVAPIVKRLPHGSEFHKRWNAVTMRWEGIMIVPHEGPADWSIGHEAPDGRMVILRHGNRNLTVITLDLDGAFRNEQEMFQTYLKSLEEGK